MATERKMGENGTNGHLNPDSVGRGTVSPLKGLDCANNPRDLATVRQAIRNWPKRWRGQTPEMKEAVVADVDAGRKRARSIMDSTPDDVTALTAIDRINTAARVHAAIEAQEQADDHLADKYDRLDNGKPTEGVDHRLVHYVNAPEGEL